MSSLPFPQAVVDAMYHEAVIHPSRGRKKNGQPTKRNISGLTGAYQCGGRGKWRSRIRIDGVTIQIKNSEGKTYFHSAQEAHEAYLEIALKRGLITSL